MVVPLTDIYRQELARPVDPRITAFAADIAAHYDGALGVLFYGSCLRESRLDGLMLDFYLIVESYDRAYDKAWLARANRLIPPNVFHAQHDRLAAKYAVLSLDDFRRQCAGKSRSVSVWARFAQPSRLVWQCGDAAAETIAAAAAAAPAALIGAARPLLPDLLQVNDLWSGAFALTYAAELRAERRTRSNIIFDAAPGWYEALTIPALAAADIPARIDGKSIHLTAPADRKAGERRWSRYRRDGKFISLARLAKATATFDGGIDYLAWKINRHAETDIKITDWQRRHPILAGIGLLPRLLASGAIK
ncbi:hypothetical protein [Pacificimonas pallii]|uniref:hypothetical protein n=1 Tax=Pacificimonas pallii TaxID=2827236 RepID=UPI003F716C06